MPYRLSRRELSRVIDQANRCLVAATFAQIEALVSGLGDLVSFEKAALCAFTPRPSPEVVSLEHVVNHSFGAKWGTVYTREQLQRVDPVLRHACRNRGAFTWSEAMGGVDHAGASFMAAARDFGLGNGASYSGSSPAGTGQRTVLSITLSSARDSERALRTLSLMGPHIHEAYKRVLVLQREPLIEAELSERERDVLSWSQQGKTYWEIGCILGISERTVKYHFSKVKAKLNVVNVSHAVAKAMRMGLIY